MFPSSTLMSYSSSVCCSHADIFVYIFKSFQSATFKWSCLASNKAGLCCLLPVTQVGCEHYRIRDSLTFLQNTVLAGPSSHLFLLKDLIFLFMILLPIFNCNLTAIKWILCLISFFFFPKEENNDFRIANIYFFPLYIASGLQYITVRHTVQYLLLGIVLVCSKY